MKIFINRKKTFIVLILALLFALMQTIGYQYSYSYGTTVHTSEFFYNIGLLSTGETVIAIVLGILFWFTLLHVLFTILERPIAKEANHSIEIKNYIFFIIAVLLFIAWIPCFLAGYPGFYNYDSFKQIPQVLYEEVPYSAHHPLLHTLFVGNIISFGYRIGGTLNDGILLHSIIQMIICALIFAYFIYYIFKLTGKRWLCVLTFCYYAFFPPIALFAMSTTKDVIFSLLLQLCVIYFYEAIKDYSGFFSSKKRVLRFITVMVLMCLFRKTGIYIVVCMLPFVAVFLKRARASFFKIFGTIIFCYFIISKCLLLGLSAEEGSPEEALSVPMQQIARVYHEKGSDSFTDAEKALISKGFVFEQLGNYNPFLSDAIKNYFDYDAIKHNKIDFLKLWLKKGLQYPKVYMDAFLANTYQAWYPGTSIMDEPYSHDTYYFSMKMYAGGERDTKAPKLLEFYEDIASGFSYQKIPLVRLFFSIGAMFWVALFVTAFAIYKNNRALYLSMLMVLLCCLTCFLGPISLVRYYLILFYGFPINIGFLLCKEESLF